MRPFARLRQLAEAATPGPWLHDAASGIYAETGADVLIVDVTEDEAGNLWPSPNDGEFIAACSPDVILSLLDSAEAAAARDEFAGSSDDAPKTKLLLGVRNELEAAVQCVSDDHALHHLNGALAMLNGAERDLEAIIADAYKHGFADSYAKQVIAAMSNEETNETDELWCAVEGCLTKPEYRDLSNGELVCRKHLDYEP